MTSPSPLSCDLHELTSSPTSSDMQDTEDYQPQGLDEDIFLRPSTYRLPCDATPSPTPSASATPYVAVNGTLSSSEDEDEAVDGIISPAEDD